MHRLIFLCSLSLPITAANTSIPLQVSATSVPPGTTAQIRITVPTPAAITSGRVVIDFDPALFGAIAAVGVFSANGDQIGTAIVQDHHLDVNFASPSGGIGRLPNLPVLTIQIPVLAKAIPGSTAPLTFSAGDTQWTDLQGYHYSVPTIQGTIAFRGGLSVQNVTQGGGLLPAASEVHIHGTGFTNSTTLQIEGVTIASTRFISSQQIDFTLGAPADLTGKHLVLKNPDGSQIDYFSALHGAFTNRPATGPLASVLPITPLQTYPAATTFTFISPGFAVVLQNQNPTTVDVIIKSITNTLGGTAYSQIVITIPPGGTYMRDGTELTGGNVRTRLTLIPSVPIRMMIAYATSTSNGITSNGSLISPTTVPVSQVTAGPDLSWDWQFGSSIPPLPKTVTVQLSDVPSTFTVTPATSKGGNWLSVSPGQGTTCLPKPMPNCEDSSKITVTVSPESIAAGVYNGTLTITSTGFNVKPAVVNVVFNVSAYPLISVDQTSLTFQSTPAAPNPPVQTVNVFTNRDPVQVTASAATDQGPNWLSVTPPTATTPSTVTIKANPTGLSGTYLGTVTFAGPGNKQTIPVTFFLNTNSPPPQITVSPASLQFSVKAGSNLALGQVISVPPAFLPVTLAADANWLITGISSGPGVPAVLVTVNATGLAPGTYQGKVTITSAGATNPAIVPVTQTVWTDPPPPVAVSPASLTFTAPSGGSAPEQQISITTGHIPFDFHIVSSTSDGSRWLGAGLSIVPPFSTPALTPNKASVFVTSTGLAPGIYHGTLTIFAPAGSTNSTTVPVTLTVTPALPPPPQPGPPLAVSIVSAASALTGPVSPGEIIAIFGQNIGTPTRILFDETPATILYASPTQVNALVPNEVAGKTSTTIQLESNGINITGAGLPTAAATPAIFTLDGTGVGKAAVLNQDNSINDPANPATRGSVIQIYATGAGPGSVSVTIGGKDAPVQFAGSTSGLLQVNAQVPTTLTPSDAVPIAITIGTIKSQDSVTIAVK